ncbi:FadR/GntR family transcriptional regulator [Actinocatenispora comari]|uniref:GntR family transcriptional regulator n=1 Tax=Actinocatenispora comari TaxID=2807577 RepID=A0A8J4ADS9_9ACTN|nr:FadR/GntR family transcriptional regulator [Actinocatenispora comari]GIL29203.1 GntR family transcriptional regulator [Actinocatenispora comari]GIL31842.1 GntR family transcriptional regulator [Actinocatenispora comari]
MSEHVPETPVPRLRPAPLHKAVQDEIRRFILRERLQAGDPLKPEAELARLFGVSRNSVREAVKALESTGVLETRRGSGVYVRDFSFTPLLEHLPYGLMREPQALNDLIGLRKTLESALIGDAIAALSDTNAAALRELLATMRQRAKDGADLSDPDRAFHQLLFADLGNTMLLQLFDLFWQAYHQATLSVPHRDPMLIVHDHAAIVEAVLAKDADAARESVRAHYVGIEERIRQELDHLANKR